ncbi:hypothetical protein UG55_11117 [Frankia sp. EI5c]|nr:hypothetical protein UG55_11117 [Frankia sp. EI5c]
MVSFANRPRMLFDAGLDAEQHPPQAPGDQCPPHLGAFDVPVEAAVGIDDLVDAAAGLPAEPRLVQQTGQLQHPAGGVGAAAEELLVDQVQRPRHLRMAVEDRCQLAQQPRQPARAGPRPATLVIAGAERAVAGAAPTGLQLRDTVTVERRRQQVELGNDVGRHVPGDRLRGPPPPNGQPTPTWCPHISQAGNLVEAAVAVPVRQQRADRGLPARPGDQQRREPAQQDPFDPGGEAAADDDQRRIVLGVDRFQQLDQQVVLAERRRHPDKIRPVCLDTGDQAVKGEPELHVSQGHRAQQCLAGRPRHRADPQRKPRQRERLRVIQRGQQHAGPRQPIHARFVHVCQRQPGPRLVEHHRVPGPRRPGP